MDCGYISFSDAFRWIFDKWFYYLKSFSILSYRSIYRDIFERRPEITGIGMIHTGLRCLISQRIIAMPVHNQQATTRVDHAVHLADGPKLMRIMVKGIRAGNHVKMPGLKGEMLSISDGEGCERTVIAISEVFVSGPVNHIVGHVQASYLDL